MRTTGRTVLHALMPALLISVLSVSAQMTPNIPKDRIPKNAPPEVRKIILQLYDGSFGQRMKAIDAMTPRAEYVPFLIGLLGDNESNIVSYRHWNLGIVSHSSEQNFGWTRAQSKLSSFGAIAVPALIAAVRAGKPEDFAEEYYRDASGNRWVPKDTRKTPAGYNGSDALRAAGALADIKDPKALPRLLRVLKDPHPRVRCAVVRAIGRSDADGKHFERLLPLLEDKEENVRRAVVWAGARCRPEPWLQAMPRVLRTDPAASIRALAAKQLGDSRSKRARSVLIEALEKDNSAEVREAAAKVLARAAGDDSVLQPLVKAAENDRSPAVRLTIHQGLSADARWNWPMELRARGIADPDAEVRRYCVQRAGDGPKSETVRKALAAALKDSDAEVREFAAHALINYNKSDRAAMFASALDSTDTAVRVQMVEGLGKVREPSAVRLLARITHDREPAVRQKAASSLIELYLHKDLRATYQEEQVVTDLLDGLQVTEKSSSRTTIISLLGRSGDARVVEPLTRLMKDDPSQPVRDAALAALQRAQAGKQTNVVIDAGLSNPDPAVRVVAGDVIEELAAGLRPGQVLGVGQNYHATAVKALKDGDALQRMAAVRLLAPLGRRRRGTSKGYVYAAPLAEALLCEKRPFIRRHIATGLQHFWGGPGVKALITILGRDPDAGVRRCAAESLGKLRDVRGKPVLEQAHKKDADPAVREAARRALAALGEGTPTSGRTADAVYQYMLKHDNGRVTESDALKHVRGN